MKLKTALCRLGMLLPVLLTLSLFSFSQNNFKVTGKVNDESGKPLEGVTVQVKGTNIATATSADGSFTINAPSGTSTLIITSVGFIQQEIALNNKTELTMSLINAASALQEVVVGY